MINLIPPTAKKRVVTEYWVRTVSLWAFLGGTALFLIATLFIPINIYVVNQESYLSRVLESGEAEQTMYQQNTELLVRANAQAALLTTAQREYTLYDVLPQLQTIADTGIKLQKVQINQTADPILSIMGVAQSRQALVSFRDALEQNKDFLVVDLPIGNLIKDSDVAFTITVTLATSTPHL